MNVIKLENTVMADAQLFSKRIQRKTKYTSARKSEQPVHDQ